MCVCLAQDPSEAGAEEEVTDPPVPYTQPNVPGWTEKEYKDSRDLPQWANQLEVRIKSLQFTECWLVMPLAAPLTYALFSNIKFSALAPLQGQQRDLDDGFSLSQKNQILYFGLFNTTPRQCLYFVSDYPS